MGVQTPVNADAQTQLAIKQLSQQVDSLTSQLKALKSGKTTINQSASSSSSTSSTQVPITESFSFTGPVFIGAAVYLFSSALVATADNTNRAKLGVIGIVSGMGAGKATVTTFGQVTVGSWRWTVGLPVFLSTGGMMTQTPPPNGYSVVVGVATGTTTLRLLTDEELSQNSSAGGFYDIPAGMVQVIPAGQISFTMGSFTNEGTLYNYGRLASL